MLAASLPSCRPLPSRLRHPAALVRRAPPQLCDQTLSPTITATSPPADVEEDGVEGPHLLITAIEQTEAEEAGDAAAAAERQAVADKPT